MSQKTCPNGNLSSGSIAAHSRVIPLLGSLDHRSLEGWGTGEDEEAGAILRVFQALGIFYLGSLKLDSSLRSRSASACGVRRGETPVPTGGGLAEWK